MIIERNLETRLLELASAMPVVAVTGPRQSGKTTLFKMLFSKTHTLVSLEDPDIRIRAKEDPLSFLNQYSPVSVVENELELVLSLHK